MKLKKRADNGIYMLTHEGRRISTGERTKAKAERAARLIIDNHGTRPMSKGCRCTLGEALTDTYNRIWQHAKSEKNMRYMVNALREEHGHVDINVINYAWLSSFVESMRDAGKTNATINRWLSVLSKALREAHKMDLLDRMPAIPTLREKRKKLRFLTPAEQIALRDCTPDLWAGPEARFMAAFVDAMVYTGGRVGEFIRACREGTYDKEHIHFTETKSGHDRRIPLRPEILPAINICSNAMREWTDRDPKVMYRRLSERFNRMCSAAGLAGVSIHTMRHTCASRMVQAGVTLPFVKEWLGHASIQTTMIYAHLAPDSLDSLGYHVVPPAVHTVAHVDSQVEGPARALHSVQNRA